MWGLTSRFYFDLTWEGKPAPVKTIGAFWMLVAGVAAPAQAKDLMRELSNPQTFKRLHRVPILAADQNGYDPAGGYSCGTVWAPTSTIVIRGLKHYGQDELAHEIALNHFDLMG